MAMVNREGRFRAQIIDKGVSLTGKNDLVTFIPRFFLIQEWDGAEWQDIEAEGMEITAYCYLIKRDGSLNDFQIKALREAFGWDGQDFFWLEDESLPDCQVVIEAETYQGKDRLKVQFINAYDSEGGGTVEKSTDDIRRRVKTQYGAKLRAMAGGKSAAKPAAKSTETTASPKPTAPSAPPPRKSPPAAPASDAGAPPMTTEDCWTQFATAATEAGITDDQIQAQWFAALNEVCGHEDIDRATPDQLAEIAGKSGVPF